MKVITLKINTAQIVRTTLGQYIEGLSKACKPNIKKTKSVQFQLLIHTTTASDIVTRTVKEMS